MHVLHTRIIYAGNGYFSVSTDLGSTRSFLVAMFAFSFDFSKFGGEFRTKVP